MINKIFVCLCLMLSLTACSSLKGNSELINYERYSLIEDLKADAFADDYEISLKLKDDLNNGGIVVKTSEVSLRSANHHLWSSALDEQLKAILTNALQEAQIKPKTKLNVFISKFYGSSNGEVSIEALVNTKKYRKTYSFNEYQSEDGYSSLVASLKHGFKQMCQEIALDLN